MHIAKLTLSFVVIGTCLGVALFSERTALLNGSPLRIAPPEEKFSSRDGVYVFTCWAGSEETPSKGRLERDGVVVWDDVLPNSIRPRFVVVTNHGYVVTFDDWSNTESPNAVVVYDQSGKPAVHWSLSTAITMFQQAGLKDLGLAEITERSAESSCGWWLQAAPAADESGLKVNFRTGNRSLTLNPKSGKIILPHK